MREPSLRNIPSVDRLARGLGDVDIPRRVIIAIIRRELTAVRQEGLHLAPDQIADRVRTVVTSLRRSRIEPLINGTGIILHTNLGRSPLSAEAVAAVAAVAGGYSGLEYGLDAGSRGGRARYVEHNLAILCEAERATVVNNCAAGLVLILRSLISAAKPQVVISRGELVQIGGGFRVPEILEASGAVLREVGTTNKTSLQDYERAIGDQTAMILRVHRSNFFMGGFVESPTTQSLSTLAKQVGVPFVEDLGSGAMFDTAEIAGEHEPTPVEVLRQGADLVCFSGDKLFGGPQAGIIAGIAAMVDAIKGQPLFRAVRCDKLVLAALQATVDSHLSGAADRGLPALAMMAISLPEMRARAQRLVDRLREVGARLGTGESRVGGGCLPQTTIPSVTLDLVPREGAVDELSNRLRRGSPPVIGYIAEGRLKIDLRTVFPAQEAELICAIRKAFGLG